MKKILFICLSFCIIISKANSQMRDTTINNHKFDADMLMKKSKKQKSAARILLGGGAGMAAIGLMIGAIEYESSDYLQNIFNPAYSPKRTPASEIMFYSGAGIMLGSIPLFIASAKNKRNAKLMIKEETVFFNPQLNLKEHLIAAGIKINF